MSDILGFAWNDLNENGVRDILIVGNPPDVVFVIDVSGSTIDPEQGGIFVGEPVGDVNFDGNLNTVLDAELAGFVALNQELINRGFGEDVDLSIVVFGADAAQLDMNPSTPGLQLSTAPAADADGDGVSDVEEILSSIRVEFQGVGANTNYQAALQETINTIDALGTDPDNGNVIFLSDGKPNEPNEDFDTYRDEVSTLESAVVNLRAFGAGEGAELPALQVIDSGADIFTSSDDLLSIFSGVRSSSNEFFAEPGLEEVEIYLDLNDNSILDPGEPTTVTDEIGDYQFTNLSPGNYIVREVVPDGFVQTSPISGFFPVTLNPGQEIADINFGNSEVDFGSISGLVWQDLNGNGMRDSEQTGGEEPNVVFIVDLSDSITSTRFRGSGVGDVNEDGTRNTILDAQLAGFIALNQDLINRNFGDSSEVSIVVFGSNAQSLDMNPLTPELELSTTPSADADNNGVPDVEQILGSLLAGAAGTGLTTDYEAALQETIDTINALDAASWSYQAILLSDGKVTDDEGISITNNNYGDEVNRLNGLGVNLKAFGAGIGAELGPLQIIDPDTELFTNRNDLLDVFNDLGDSSEFIEPGQGRVQVYLDENNNGFLDRGEPTTRTAIDDPTTPEDETGNYQFPNLVAGEYIVREVVPESFRQTFPADDDFFEVLLNAGEAVADNNFGNVKLEAPTPPTLIEGTPEDETVTGTTGNDFIFGFAGDDVLLGGSGNDFLNGDSGDDILAGGEGRDILLGGNGNDTFVLSSDGGVTDLTDADVLVTFTPGVDLIQIELTAELTRDDIILEALGVNTLILNGSSDEILGIVSKAIPEDVRDSLVFVDVM